MMVSDASLAQVACSTAAGLEYRAARDLRRGDWVVADSDGDRLAQIDFVLGFAPRRAERTCRLGALRAHPAQWALRDGWWHQAQHLGGTVDVQCGLQMVGIVLAAGARQLVLDDVVCRAFDVDELRMLVSARAHHAHAAVGGDEDVGG
jgi:hypothetical protein